MSCESMMACAALCIVCVVLAHCHMLCLSHVVKVGGNKRLRAQRRLELARKWRLEWIPAEKGLDPGRC